MKIYLITAICFIILCIQVAFAKHEYNERFYQNAFCSRWHGTQEVKLKDYTRVDCITKSYAVEFDFAKKWAEAIGQSLYYSKMTGKKAAIVLIIEQPNDWKHYNKIKQLCKDHNITLWYMISPSYDKTNKIAHLAAYHGLYPY